MTTSPDYTPTTVPTSSARPYAAGRSADKRRQARLDALYARLEGDPHSLGRAYQVVGSHLARGKGPDGKPLTGGKVTRVLWVVLIYFTVASFLHVANDVKEVVQVSNDAVVTGTVIQDRTYEDVRVSPSGRTPRVTAPSCVPVAEYFVGDVRYTATTDRHSPAACDKPLGRTVEVTHPKGDPADGTVVTPLAWTATDFGFNLPGTVLFLLAVRGLARPLRLRLRGRRLTSKGESLTADSFPSSSIDVEAEVAKVWSDPEFVPRTADLKTQRVAASTPTPKARYNHSDRSAVASKSDTRARLLGVLTSNRRRQARLDALYASYGPNRAAVGEAYQVVGEALLTGVDPGGRRYTGGRSTLGVWAAAFALFTSILFTPILAVASVVPRPGEVTAVGTVTEQEVKISSSSRSSSGGTRGGGGGSGGSSMDCALVVDYSVDGARYTTEKTALARAYCGNPVGSEVTVAHQGLDPASGRVRLALLDLDVLIAVAQNLFFGLPWVLFTLGLLAAPLRQFRGRRLVAEATRMRGGDQGRPSDAVRSQVAAAWKDPVYAGDEEKEDANRGKPGGFVFPHKYR